MKILSREAVPLGGKKPVTFAMHFALAQSAHIASSVAPQHLSLAVPARKKFFLLKNNVKWNFNFITNYKNF
jgi:hypothetical protein